MENGFWYFKCYVNVCGQNRIGEKFDISKNIQVPLYLALGKDDAEKQAMTFIEKYATVNPDFLKQYFDLDDVENDYIVRSDNLQICFEEEL